MTANPSATAPKTTYWNPWLNPPTAANRCSSMMSKVPSPGARKNMPRKPSSMKIEPNSVKRKNLIAAYCRFAPPQIAIRKYMGTSTSSQKTKNRMRSNEMKVPAIPVSSSSISARNGLVRPGSGRNRHV